MQYQGRVARLTLSPGSKSEHAAVVLVTADGPLKLRRAGGNPFADPELDKLVGQDVACEGELVQGQLVIDSWRVTGGPP